ncbi:tetraacyldisaccharide 4'-kinase [Janthinobacterium sp. 17J80-10]|uniref:tetraacyldisaccharide 4'-kinase n=1 Tax=Janthinobacterium sp. 17J80-10 TaxID=2497863 RepID=UPI0010052D3B|nr:tetraacyldisaccharide 4'-kinase [Janthinobacterium sp. 17J80-10]QAU35347.1 tetraacyldisaccharide 4'-kinase [Janthinobacterium sp. 17J80-10]
MLAQIESALTRAWLRRGLLARALLPVSWLFGLLGAVRRRLYAAGMLKSTRLPVPVIVVGNIFVGGTGKTPLTIWLVQALRAAGFTPGVISRGYGASAAPPRRIGPESLPQEGGDEPLLIATRAACPVMVGRDRAAAGQALLAACPEVDLILSDDGLQHYALQRDIEIILYDSRGNGNGWLLPAGPLREPAHRRRDITVVNASQPVAAMPAGAIRMQLEGTVAERLADRTQSAPLATLGLPRDAKAPPRLVAAAGIGNPARFFATLRAVGLHFDEMPLPDHYDFLTNPFAEIDADIILITEKDAVKCRQLDALKNDPRIWVVPVTARIEGALLDQLLEKLRGRSPA